MGWIVSDDLDRLANRRRQLAPQSIVGASPIRAGVNDGNVAGGNTCAQQMRHNGRNEQ